MRVKILIALGLTMVAARVISAQCYTFSSGTAASLTVNITHLPTPTRSTSVPSIWDYSSDSGLAATVSLKVGQTTYIPDPSSGPPSIDVSVASDSSSSFSDIPVTAAFFSTGHLLVSALADIDYWSGAYFPNGNLPATLPVLSNAHSTDFLVSADSSSGTVFDQTLTVTSISSCNAGDTTTPPAGMPSLSVSSTHRGTFLAGQPLAQYTLGVQNTGTVASSGPVYVSDILPVGLNATALSGNGWSCSVVGLICSRSDSLPAGTSYAPIALTASVASYTSGTLTNQATLSGGGSSTSTASDPTNIAAAFVDVLPSDSFLPAIDLLKEYGITSGCSLQGPMFCPNDNISQAQMAVFVVRSIVGSDNFNGPGRAKTSVSWCAVRSDGGSHDGDDRHRKARGVVAAI